jgi:hypothetical protein
MSQKTVVAQWLYYRLGFGMTPEQFGDSLAALEAGPLGEARDMRTYA